MRIAWFSPTPPERSGIASYSAELVPQLRGHRIDVVGEHAAHDYVWAHQLEPYDLTVYQLGNAACHDYMWAYLARYPGLVVLHDARLHQARARRLLRAQRFDDYRAEFWYDHPDAVRDVAEYAVEGLGGSIYYFWSMLRVVLRTARLVAVHNARVGADLRDASPETRIETIRMGVPALSSSREAARRVRRAHSVPDEAFAFVTFGNVTPEKRVGTILRALGTLTHKGRSPHLLIVGDAGDPTDVAAWQAEVERRGVGHLVHLTGYVADEAIGDYLAAADACLCLRWPTALETSASWLRCLAAARPTIISDLAHLVDIPALEARTGRSTHSALEPVTIVVDLLDEDQALVDAMRRMMSDAALRGALASAGHEYWAQHHRLELMAGDYQRILELASQLPVPVVADLPPHFVDAHAALVRRITADFGVTIDWLDEERRR